MSIQPSGFAKDFTYVSSLLPFLAAVLLITFSSVPWRFRLNSKKIPKDCTRQIKPKLPALYKLSTMEDSAHANCSVCKLPSGCWPSLETSWLHPSACRPCFPRHHLFGTYTWLDRAQVVLRNLNCGDIIHLNLTFYELHQPFHRHILPGVPEDYTEPLPVLDVCNFVFHEAVE